MKKFFFILIILVSAGIGGWTGYHSSEVNSDLMELWFQLGFILIAIGLFSIIHIIIHELGHLIAAKLTGYRFLYFRVMSWALVKEQSKFRIARFSIAGTAGQCLMIPPSNVEPMPYKLYLWGGALANFVVGLIGIILNGFVFDSLYLYIFSITSLIFGIINIYPFSFNDGNTVKHLNRDPVKRQQFFQQLELAGSFTIGKEFEAVDTQSLIENPNEPITEQYNAFVTLAKVYRELERENFGHALEILEPLWQQRNDLVKPYQIEVMREYLFCHLTLGLHETSIQDEILQDKLFREYLKTKQLETYRMQAAISLWVEYDLNQAQEWISKARDSLKQSPTYADKALNTKLLNFISLKVKQEKAEKITMNGIE